MSEKWDQARLQTYINNEIEEGHRLEYKGARSLGRNNKEKDEITKDVSAMANADGGIVIYGIAEYQEDSKRHLPERTDPIDCTQYSKEWLEQIINTVQPIIEGVVIHSVPLDSGENHVAYVVEVPKATTAHQARDKRYYRRTNFMVGAMYDDQIRDVMARGKHPRFEVDLAVRTFSVERVELIDPSSERSRFGIETQRVREKRRSLDVRLTNTGQVYAHYVNCNVQLPVEMVFSTTRDLTRFDRSGVAYVEVSKRNMTRDVIGWSNTIPPDANYGPARFEPILPGTTYVLEIALDPTRSEYQELLDLEIEYAIFADNAPPIRGVAKFGDIPGSVVAN